MGEVETVEHHNEKELSVAVYFGKRSGSATTSAFDRQAILDTVDAACSIARHTANDPCNGLPDTNRLARTFPDLELHLPWSLDREKAFEIAFECEDTARAHDDRIINSDGATVSTSISMRR